MDPWVIVTLYAPYLGKGRENETGQNVSLFYIIFQNQSMSFLTGSLSCLEPYLNVKNKTECQLLESITYFQCKKLF